MNTAARLESVTKELPSPIAILGEAYGHLEDESQTRLIHLGEVPLKAKRELCTVCGLPAVNGA